MWRLLSLSLTEKYSSRNILGKSYLQLIPKQSKPVLRNREKSAIDLYCCLQNPLNHQLVLRIYRSAPTTLNSRTFLLALFTFQQHFSVHQPTSEIPFNEQTPDLRSAAMIKESQKASLRKLKFIFRKQIDSMEYSFHVYQITHSKTSFMKVTNKCNISAV